MTPASVLQQLYGDVDGYTTSSIGRMRTGSSRDPAFTYGEVTPDSVRIVLNSVPHSRGEVFYDLGSGNGKAVIFAALLGQFSKAVGIELLDELHLEAVGVKLRYESDVRPHLAAPQKHTKIDFRKEDVFHADMHDADVVFVHCCTCFPDPLMARLSDKLHSLKKGARVVMVTRGLNSKAFTRLGTYPCQMGWGMATLNVYRKN